MTYSFGDHQAIWKSVPVDDVAYIDTTELLALPDHALRKLVDKMERARYGGYRNHKNLWRHHLGLDTTTGKFVVDYGCGLGVESLQFNRAGNRVLVADICETNVLVAQRVQKLYGHDSEGLLINEHVPYLDVRNVDVFYSNGVLHHTPEMPQILEWMASALALGGEIRLMLYSDRGWIVATGTEPPEGDVAADPEWPRFCDFFDGVGSYADFYSREKLAAIVPEGCVLESFNYITSDGRFCVSVLRKTG